MSKSDNDSETPNPDSFKFVVQLHNVFSTEPNANTPSDGPRKRTIIMKDDDAIGTFPFNSLVMGVICVKKEAIYHPPAQRISDI